MKDCCDIIIVNWNSGNLLNKCVLSINQNKGEKVFPKIYIVDNASTDNSLHNIDRKDNIHIIKNKVNLGFAAACNQGIGLSHSKYMLFLNPDTELLDNTLVDSFLFMENNSDVDILGVKHIDKKKTTLKSCSRFPTLKNYFYDIVGLSKVCPGTFTPATIMIDWDHEDSRYVDQVMGAFFFVRRRSLEKYGEFDERFFVYYEDLDFARRVRGGEGKIFYLSDVMVTHEGGGSTSQIKNIRLFYSLRSRLLYSSKYFSKYSFIVLGFLTLTVEPITRSIYLLVRMRPREVFEVFRGYVMLYGYLIRKYL